MYYINNVYIICGTRIFFLLLSISQFLIIFFPMLGFANILYFYVFFIIILNNLISVFIFF